MGQVRRTVFHTAVYAAGIVLNRGVAFLLVPVYTRTLTKAEFALWDLCAIVILFLAPLFELGMSAALLRFYHHDISAAERERVIRTGYTFVGLFVAGLFAAAFAFREPLAGLALRDAALSPLMTLCLITAACTVLGNQPLALLRAREQSLVFSLLNLLRALLGPAAIILFVVVWGWGVQGVLLGELIGLTAMVCIAYLLYPRFLVPLIDLALLRRMLRYAVPLIPLGLASVVTLMSDRFFLVHHIGAENMAVFSLGFRVAMIMVLLSRAFQTAWPASALQLDKTEAPGPVFAQLFRLTMAGMCGAALALSAFAPELVWIFGGAGYENAALIAPWIAFSYALYVAAYFITTNLVIVHRTTHQMLVFVFGAALKIFFNWVLIAGFIRWFPGLPAGVAGSLGAALATFLAYSIELVAAYWVTQRYYPVPYELPRLGLLALLCGIGLGGTFAAEWLLAYPASLAVRAILLAAFAAALPLAGLVTKEEQRRVYAFLARRLGRAR